MWISRKEYNSILRDIAALRNKRMKEKNSSLPTYIWDVEYGLTVDGYSSCTVEAQRYWIPQHNEVVFQQFEDGKWETVAFFNDVLAFTRRDDSDA